MRNFVKNAVIKKVLIVLITIIMISNFIMPTKVYAKTDLEDVANGFFYLLAKLGDVGIKIMQDMMVGDNEIQNGDNFEIKYSPGKIFAGEVPTLDINFISPDQSKKDATKYEEVEHTDTYGPFQKGSEILIDYGFNESDTEIIENGKILPSQYGDRHVTKRYIWKTSNGDQYRAEVMTYANGTSTTIYRTYLTKESVGEAREISSMAAQLQKGVSKWYNVLRMMATVGLLSVLVYLGIRIILSSSSAQDKAKYKNMLKDWVVALCILYSLHFIMAFLLNVTQKVTDIINDGILNGNEGVEYDVLMSEVRNNIGANLKKAFKTDGSAGYSIMYLALVILTGAFTFQYLKRVIFMAFLTIIAPLVALTYPLDKIKDSKAQAFSFWTKEYIFNCLIQPVHLLIYSVLLGSAMDFAKQNVLYGVVTLAFMVPAEKFIKEMFGLSTKSPSGTLNAAAGGAVVMSMLNKMKRPPVGDAAKEQAGGGSSTTATSSKGIRTLSNNSSQTSTTRTQNQIQQGAVPLQQNQNNNSKADGYDSRLTGEQKDELIAEGITPDSEEYRGALSNFGIRGADPNLSRRNTSTGVNSTINKNNSAINTTNSALTNSSSSAFSNTSSNRYGERNIGRGIWEATKRHVKGPTFKSNVGRFTGVAGAILGGGALLAAQVADGDLIDNPEKAITQIATGAGAGYIAGNSLGTNAVQTVKNAPDWVGNIGDQWDKDSLSAEGYQNLKIDKEAFKSDGYKLIEQDGAILSRYGSSKENVKMATQQFLDNGMTEMKDIRTLMQHDVTGNEYKEYQDLGLKSVDDMVKLKDAQINPVDYKVFADMGITDAGKVTKAKDVLGKDKNGDKRDSRMVASLAKIAQMAPKGDKKKFIDFASDMIGTLRKNRTRPELENEAEELYKQILNLW